MDEITKDLGYLFSTHWPFIAVTIILMMIGQVSKISVFTKQRAHALHGTVWGEVVWWGRKTLPLHPMISGAIIGLVWRNPTEMIDRVIESVAYFALAGTLSVWAYQILKSIAKKKGYELGPLPGAESTPPPIPPDGKPE